MGLAKQLFLLRRGGGTGACGRVEADIFGGKGGFTVFMLRSSRCKREKMKFNFHYQTLAIHQRFTLTYFSQMIRSFRVTMELVIARVTEEILHTLLTFDDGSNRPTKFTL